MLDQKVIFLIILLVIIYFVSSNKENFGPIHEGKVKLFDGRCTPVNDFAFYGMNKDSFADKCRDKMQGQSGTCKKGLLSGRKCTNKNNERYNELLNSAKIRNDWSGFPEL